MRSFVHAFGVLSLVASHALGRVWTDDTGEKQVEAEFVSLNDNEVKFRLPSGEVRRCDREQLSAEDQIVVAALAVVSDPPAVAEAAASAPARLMPANVDRRRGNAEPCPPAQTYECTVMVPEMVTEMRTISVCEWRSEQRQHTYTACRMVPETRQVTYEYTVPSYETRTREFVYSVFKPVLSTQQCEYTVMVPHTEKRQGTRRVCEMVPVEMSRTVCEDHGSWQQVVRHYGCDCCGPCDRVCNVWSPKIENARSSTP